MARWWSAISRMIRAVAVVSDAATAVAPGRVAGGAACDMAGEAARQNSSASAPEVRSDGMMTRLNGDGVEIDAYWTGIGQERLQ
jgi:hypothetical protein